MKKGLKSMLLAGLMAGSLAVTGCELSFNNDSDLEKQQQEIYKLAKEAGFEGTYEEWLDSIKGAKGEKGDAGATWHTGTVAPTDTLGKNGDFYYDSVALKVYHKEDGVWVSKSSLGMKNILKIEKVSSGDEIDVYRITYTDNTTDEFEVSKDVDLVTATQEELFTEFRAIAANSMAKPYYYAIAELTSQYNGGSVNTMVGQVTTDENGFYSVSDTDESYYIKVNDKYVRYYRDPVKEETDANYVDEEQWEYEKQNYLSFIDDDTEDVFMGDNLFSSNSIDEMIRNLKINFVNGDSALLPINPEIELSKEYNEDMQKEILTLTITANYKNVDDGDIEYSFSIECYDNEIKRLYYKYGYVDDSELDPRAKNMTYEIHIEYFTNENLIPSEDYFDEFPTPSELE